MSQGTGTTITLYDTKGNAVSVVARVDGTYALAVSDAEIQALASINDALQQLLVIANAVAAKLETMR